MKKILRTLAAGMLLALVMVPAGARAADEPAITIKRVEDRVVSVRYENLPLNGTLAFLNSKDEPVRRVAHIRQSTGTKDFRLPKDMASGTYTVHAFTRDGKSTASATFTVTAPPPTCRMTVSDKKPQKGDMVTIRWSSENAESGLLFGKRVGTHGSERIALGHAGLRGFTANFFGKGGIKGCSVQVRVSE